MTKDATPGLRRRAREFLLSCPDAVDADALAREVLNIRGAPRAVAERLVSSLLDGAEGFVREDGRGWRYVAPVSHASGIAASPGPPASRGSRGVLVIGATTWRDSTGRNSLIEIVVGPYGRHTLHRPVFQVRFRLEGTPAADAVDETSMTSLSETLPALLPILERDLVIAYRPAEVLRPIADQLLIDHGLDLEVDALSLARLSQRCLPGAAHHDLHELAAALGLPHYASSRARDQYDLTTRVLSAILDRSDLGAVPDAEGLRALDEAPAGTKRGPRAPDFDEMWLEGLPETPGIYRMFDRQGRLLYVGKARSLRRRVLQYFRSPAGRDERAERILADLHWMEFEETGSELVALLQEEKEIRERSPLRNVQREVAARKHRPVRSRNLALVLPGAGAGDATVLFYQPPFPVRQVRIPRDGDIEDAARETLRLGLLLEPANPDLPEPGDADRAAIEIARSWLHLHRNDVVVVDLDSARHGEHALRLIEDARRSLPDRVGVEHR